MIPKFAINPEGLTRRQTYEELTHTKPFTFVHPDRSSTILRNSREMSQLLNMGMYELEENQRREMMERQKVDMLSAIARSSDLTMTQLKILNKRKPIPDAGSIAAGPVDFEMAYDEITDDEARQLQQKLEKQQLLRASLLEQFDQEADPVVQTIELASGSGEDPNRMAAAEISPTPEEQAKNDAAEIIEQAKNEASEIIEQAKLAFKRTGKKRPMTAEEELRHKQALQGIVETTPSPKKGPPQSPGLQYIQVSEAIERTYKKVIRVIY